MDLFSPSATTVNIAANTGSQSAQISNQYGLQQVRVANTGTVVAFVSFGDKNVAASASAGLPILPGTVAGFSVVTPIGGQLFAAAIVASGSATVYFTPGSGI